MKMARISLFFLLLVHSNLLFSQILIDSVKLLRKEIIEKKVKYLSDSSFPKRPDTLKNGIFVSKYERVHNTKNNRESFKKGNLKNGMKNGLWQNYLDGKLTSLDLFMKGKIQTKISFGLPLKDRKKLLGHSCKVEYGISGYTLYNNKQHYKNKIKYDKCNMGRLDYKKKKIIPLDSLNTSGFLNEEAGYFTTFFLNVVDSQFIVKKEIEYHKNGMKKNLKVSYANYLFEKYMTKEYCYDTVKRYTINDIIISMDELFTKWDNKGNLLSYFELIHKKNSIFQYKQFYRDGSLKSVSYFKPNEKRCYQLKPCKNWYFWDKSGRLIQRNIKKDYSSLIRP